MRFTCPACSKSYRLPDGHLGPSGGAKVKCPSCQTLVRIQLQANGTLEATAIAASGAFAPSSAAAAAAAPHAGATAAGRATGDSGAVAGPGATARTTGAAAATRSPDGATSAPIWHVAVGKSAQGPMTIAQIQGLLDRGQVDLSALGWRKGMANWTKLQDIAELQGHLRAPLRGPQVDPAGHDPSGSAPTVMADVVRVEPAAESPSDFYKASTLKPERTSGASAALPRARAAEPARPTTTTGPAAAAAATHAPRAATAAAAPPAAAATAPASAATAARKQPSQPVAVAAQPAPLGGGSPLGATTQGGGGSSFFGGGEGFGEMDLDLPDPNKHKPSKEEYQNLLQEFSVMFRLDKRSKRQKVAIGIVLSALLVGVVAFGVILTVQGQKRQALIRDSKTILAVFSLPYNGSVTINLSREAEEEAAKTGEKVADAPAGTRQTSDLANRLRTKIMKTRIDGAAGVAAKPRPAAPSQGTSVAGVRLTKEQQDALEAARKEALAQALGSVGGKQERVVGASAATSQVSTDTLRKLCGSKLPSLRGCGESAGVGGFVVEITVGLNGGLDSADAKVGGSRNGDLSGCASRLFGKINYGPQESKTSYRCEVN